MRDPGPAAGPGPTAGPGTPDGSEHATSVAPTRLRGVGVLPALVVLAGAAVVIVGIGGRLVAPAERPAASPDVGAPAAPTPAAAAPTERPPVTAVALLGIDLPPAIGSYEASRVLATLQVFGRVTDPGASLVAELRDAARGTALGTAEATATVDGAFRADLPFLPPAEGGRVVLELRDAGGAVLATVPYVVRTRGPLVFRAPDRLVGWQTGEVVEVTALVRGTAARALARIREEDGRTREEVVVAIGPAEDGWRSIRARLAIPSDLPLGRAWLEVEVADRGEEPGAVARLLLRVAP